MSSFQNFSQGNVWRNNEQKLDLGRLFKDRLYTRPGAIPTNAALADFDPGIFYMITSASGATTLGQLYVHYEIELMTPQPFNASFFNSQGITASASYTDTSILSVLIIPATAASFGNVATITSSGVLTFNQNFEGVFNLSATGASVSASYFAVDAATTCTAITYGSRSDYETGTSGIMVRYIRALAG